MKRPLAYITAAWSGEHMAISTYKTFLMKKSATAWEKLIDIKEFPDLGGSPEMLETTTLSHKMQTYIPGIQSSDGLEFVANYTLEDYQKIKALTDVENKYAVWFGGTENGDVVTPTGSDGKFQCDGRVFAFPTGSGVNEIVNMTVVLVPSTPITLDVDA